MNADFKDLLVLFKTHPTTPKKFLFFLLIYQIGEFTFLFSRNRFIVYCKKNNVKKKVAIIKRFVLKWSLRISLTLKARINRMIPPAELIKSIKGSRVRIIRIKSVSKMNIEKINITMYIAGIIERTKRKIIKIPLSFLSEFRSLNVSLRFKNQTGI
jgi:hypothetical protein